ncbi:hypothetical protein K439DRAFT_440850 [Ramaria rubella]|nr:hypothetical protein K439DRAFT_440850 [Ramaria rubella]
MQRGGSSSNVFLPWQCPQRASRSRLLKHIPIDTYEEIFAWLRPSVHPDMDLESHRRFLAQLATVCRYFAYYTIRELCRSLHFGGMKLLATPRAPTGRWCTGIIKQRQPMETLRLEVRECILRDWGPLAGRGTLNLSFLKQFPRVLPRLENLRKLTLSNMPISQTLLWTVAELPVLQELTVSMCCLEAIPQQESLKVIAPRTEKTPCLTLQELAISHMDRGVLESRYADFFASLGAAPNLRSVSLADSFLLNFMIPHLSRDLTSLCGNFTTVDADAFIRFIKGHPSIQALTIYAQEYDVYVGEGLDPVLVPISHHLEQFPHYTTFKLDQEDLPNLQSFSGPSNLVSTFISGRSVSKVGLSCHLYNNRDLELFLPSLHGLTVFPHTNITTATQSNYTITEDDGVWEDLKVTGGVIRDVYMRISPTTPITLISSCLKNLTRLQIVSPLANGMDVDEQQHGSFLSTLEEALNGLKFLRSLIVCNSSDLRYGSQYGLSPGHQHDLVQKWRPFADLSPNTLLGPMDSIWELEILSPSFLSRGLQRTSSLLKMM